MEFRDLKRQYEYNREAIDSAISKVIASAHFIQGDVVSELEKKLEEYVGVKHCITCANGTDALQLALMAWGIGPGDAVFVPDFTFFSSGEVVSAVGATPIFVDVNEDTYNMDPISLRHQIVKVLNNNELSPRVVIAVDLFGLPADYQHITEICDEFGLLLLEDGAQGFGGHINGKKACSFGDISTTSFFPAKPLGCYGDGGAIFTNDDDWAAMIRSLCVHGKGSNKYDNVRIGMNSRLDTIQAAILTAKLTVFEKEELDKVQEVADIYNRNLNRNVKTPVIPKGYYSSWAQYTIQLENKQMRDDLQSFLKEIRIPTMIYYQKPMHRQGAFSDNMYLDDDYFVSNTLVDTVLSLPFHPYLDGKDIFEVIDAVNRFYANENN